MVYPVDQQAYDRAITLFSPDGMIYQVEYALKVVERGTIGLGVIFKDGIILAGDRKTGSNLLDISSMEKIFQIDKHIGAVSSGLIGDARRLVQMAREKAGEEKLLYDEKITVSYLAKYISSIVHLYTQYGGARPFGVSIIIAGKDATGYKMFEIEPSGALAAYKALAIGKARQDAMDYLEKNYKDDLTLEDAGNLVIRTLKDYFEKQKQTIDFSKIAFAIIDDKGFRYLTKAEVDSFTKQKKK